MIRMHSILCMAIMMMMAISLRQLPKFVVDDLPNDLLLMFDNRGSTFEFHLLVFGVISSSYSSTLVCLKLLVKTEFK